MNPHAVACLSRVAWERGRAFVIARCTGAGLVWWRVVAATAWCPDSDWRR